MQCPRTTGAGFTLIELLTVFGIILVLTAIALPAIGAIRNSARAAQTATQVQAIYAACQVYALEDRHRMPPPAEADLTLRTAQGSALSNRTLDLLNDRGIQIDTTHLGPVEATGRALLDGWRRPLRYQPDIDMDGSTDKPAPQADWNAKSDEPYPYVWSLGRPSGDDVADADASAAAHWIYVKTSPP
jgi:type II secretory pathway pseudopilin PulG